MYDASKPSASYFWTFSIETYRRDGVASRCLNLQDRDGLDVNVMLFALYAASRGRRLDVGDFLHIEQRVTPWREQVVHPLRGVRRWLKHETASAPKAVGRLRQRVVAAELEAEAHQQQIMEELLPIAPGVPDGALAVNNLQQYLTLKAVRMDHERLSDVVWLLRSSFPSLDEAEVRATLG